jgi:LuxR family transcriptional regulator, maltose regulon positive regulatory protein
LSADYIEPMFAPVLTTKLYTPRPRAQLVARPHLIERLNQGLRSKLTLISAPVGFGKTTLVSAWVASGQRPVAWLSLDEADSDLTRFLTYLITALQTVAPDIGNIAADLLSGLHSLPAPPTEAILTALLNSISSVAGDFILVLDDYHLIDAKAVDLAITFLLEHLPAPMHLLITTREDPNLPLARLRVSHQLTELRAADLRFTPAEIADFLSQMINLKLSSQEVAVLEARTEGWIAGLQLAVLSLQGHHDVPGFIQAFAGDDRYIVDYLVEEVLQRQPEAIRGFLLQTSILDRLNGSLCDALTAQSGGRAQLEALQRGNFFLIPLDDKRQWYRYHQLFSDVLRMYLITERPDQVPVLHQRASVWFEHQGAAADAIRHALVAKDFERAAALIERAVPAMRQQRQEAILLGWLQLFPETLLRRRPVLSVHFAGALLASGQLEGVEARLRDAEGWLETAAGRLARPAAAEMLVVDEEGFRNLPGLIAIFRAASALALGKVDDTIKYAHQAIDLLPKEDQLGLGAASGLLGLSYWTDGKLEAAHRSYADCLARLQRVGHTSDAIGIGIALADIQLVRGRLTEAMSCYQRGLQLATEQGALVLRGAADMYVGISEIERQRNDLSAATQQLLSSQQLGEFNGLPQNPYRWRVAMARIRQAHGDSDGALKLLIEAERLYMGDFFPKVRPVAALKARVWVAQGRLADARSWVREQQLSAQDELNYLHEFEHITLARILLADQSALEAMQLLERLLNAARAGGRTGSVIEILVLQGLALQAESNLAAALSALAQALTLAEPEGYIRIFLDEGSAMQQLLLEAAKHKIEPSYTGRLLLAFQAEPQRNAGQAPLTDWRGPPSPASQPLFEILSQRELQVLRLFKTDLSGPEIAQKLDIALSTVRTHTKSIFGKLDVKNRRAAVKRASELDLI